MTAKKAAPASKSAKPRGGTRKAPDQAKQSKSTPAKKATPRKAAGTSQRAPKRARQRAAARPGPLPLVLEGFSRKDLRWSPTCRAALVLAALRAGATWELSARIAKLNQATPREWNTRGQAILAELPHEGCELDPNTPDETVAYLAFHLEAEAAKVGTVVQALQTIDRASRMGNVTAATEVLKRHPDAKPYRPDPRLELTGPEGGPIPITVRDEARTKLEGMAKRLAENTAAAEPAEPEPATPPDETGTAAP